MFGGQSAEHEVSIQSAKNVVAALDKSKYEAVPIGITKKGKWHSFTQAQFNLLASKNYQALPEKVASESLPIVSVKQGNLDVVFPILHGPMGEDGTVQGLLKLMDIPFIGADVLGSALGMDKDVMKRLLRDAGLPIAKFLVFHKKNNTVILANGVRPESTKDRSWTSQDDELFLFVKKQLGLPFFVKPANLGSSVGVSKVHSSEEFDRAIDKAFSYDRKILVEEGIDAREIECSVLGNEEKIASVPGEIIPSHEFYDYEAKYIDEDGAILDIPAKLNKKQVKEIQEMAIKACQVLCVDGMARVDFFIDKKTDKIYINEINTTPGFTNISMYPKLWEASGIPYAALIDRLISLALERHKKRV